MENGDYTLENVTFNELRKSSTFGGENHRYDLVAVYSNGIGGLSIMGCTNTFTLTIAFTDKEKALDVLDKYGKDGLPCDVVGLTVELPQGVQRNINDEWRDCKFVRMAVPKGTEKTAAQTKLAQIMRQCNDASNDYWRIVE